MREVIDALDDRGRWIEQGALRNPENRRERIEAEILVVPHVYSESELAGALCEK